MFSRLVVIGLYVVQTEGRSVIEFVLDEGGVSWFVDIENRRQIDHLHRPANAYLTLDD